MRNRVSRQTDGSLSIGCRIRFSEDFHLYICQDEHLRIQWRQKGMEVLQMFRRKAEKRILELSPDSEYQPVSILYEDENCSGF